jgi:hypothetical protein
MGSLYFLSGKASDIQFALSVYPRHPLYSMGSLYFLSGKASDIQFALSVYRPVILSTRRDHYALSVYRPVILSTRRDHYALSVYRPVIRCTQPNRKTGKAPRLHFNKKSYNQEFLGVN